VLAEDPTLKIIVCVKQVPDTETRIKIAAEGNAIVEADVNWIISPYDEFAIEEALKIKEARGGEVVLVCLGPDRAQAALRNGLAMGADSAVHLKDPLFDQADSLGTARALAAAIKGLAPFDLVLAGHQGVGGDHSQVPGLLAELLDLPQVSVAVKIEIQEGKAIVEREIEGARESWETSLPAVISTQKGLNEPRYASLKGIMAAKKKSIEAKDAAALGLDAAALAPRTRVTALELPPARPAVKMIDGDAAAQAQELIRLLHEEAKVI
jgi:electron transfer flavoprotein beta subunit